MSDRPKHEAYLFGSGHLWEAAGDLEKVGLTTCMLRAKLTDELRQVAELHSVVVQFWSRALILHATEKHSNTDLSHS